MRPAYFVVQRSPLGPQPAIFWDDMPRIPPRDIEYVVRLDELPGGERMVERPVTELYGVYLQMKQRNTLPPRWQPPKPKKPQ